MSQTLVIGVDGATFRLIDRYREDLETIDSLISSGFRTELRSTNPDITSVAWPSFATGQNPGRTGLFDFMQRDPSTLEFSLNDVRRLTFDFFWEYLDGPTGVASVPMIPYRSDKGFFIQGSLARINAERISNPPELERYIEPSYDYHVDLSEPTDEIVRHLLDRIEAREQFFCHLLEEFDLECYFLMFSAVDFAQHHFWAYANENHPAHRPSQYENVLKRIYIRIDEALGELISRAPPDVNIFLVSDHGFTSRHTSVNLNAFLRKTDMLHFVDEPGLNVADQLYWMKNLLTRTSLYKFVPDFVSDTVKNTIPSSIDFDEKIDWQRTKAYSFGAGGNIYLNLQGREQKGIVPPSQYEEVRASVEDQLMEVTDPRTGEQIISDVSFREDVYDGPFLNRAPDIVLRPSDGYYLTAKHGKDVFEPNPEPMPNSGMHEPEGILIASGPDIVSGGGDTRRIYDVAPTLVHLHDCTVPEAMDGKVITSMLNIDRSVDRENVSKPERRRTQGRILALRQLGLV